MPSIAVQSMTAYRLRWRPKFPETKLFRDTERSLEKPVILKFDISRLTFGDMTIPYTSIQYATLHTRKNLFDIQQMLWFETETCLYMFLLGEPFEESKNLPFQIENFESRLSIRELIFIPIEFLTFLLKEVFIELFFAPLKRHKYKSNPFIRKIGLIAIDYFLRFIFILFLVVVSLNIYNPFR